jgi:hypothetical protein
MKTRYSPNDSAINRHVNSRKRPSTDVAWPLASSQPAAAKDAITTTTLNKNKIARSDTASPSQRRRYRRRLLYAFAAATATARLSFARLCFRNGASGRTSPLYKVFGILRTISRAWPGCGPPGRCCEPNVEGGRRRFHPSGGCQERPGRRFLSALRISCPSQPAPNTIPPSGDCSEIFPQKDAH